MSYQLNMFRDLKLQIYLEKINQNILMIYGYIYINLTSFIQSLKNSG